MVEDSHVKDVELICKLPEEVTDLSNIVYRINAQDCQQLWQRSLLSSHTHGVSVAQRLECWTYDLAVLGSIPDKGVITTARSTQPSTSPG